MLRSGIVVVVHSSAGTNLDLHLNPSASERPPTVLAQDPAAFHRGLPGYRATSLRSLPGIAASLGVGEVWAKIEDDRWGLPAFKVLGASWAVHRLLEERGGDAQLAALVSATDGNHGRAVARVARDRGLAARIYVPDGTSERRINDIRGEGASVLEVDGTYDDAVVRAAASIGPADLLVADTSDDPEDDVSPLIVEGYSTIFTEVAEQHPRSFDTVVVGIGVGSLAAATVRFARSMQRERAGTPAVLGVEPVDAACVLTSLRAGRRTAVPGPHRSIMAGLNCGEPSAPTWPELSEGLNAVCAVDDADAREAVRVLRAEGIEIGFTGAAPVAGLLRLRRAGRLEAVVRNPGSASVLVVLTEGPTD